MPYQDIWPKTKWLLQNSYLIAFPLCQITLNRHQEMASPFLSHLEMMEEHRTTSIRQIGSLS